jgi:hypothetical protein
MGQKTKVVRTLILASMKCYVSSLNITVTMKHLSILFQIQERDKQNVNM